MLQIKSLRWRLLRFQFRRIKFLVIIRESIEATRTWYPSMIVYSQSCCGVMPNGSSQQFLCFADVIWCCDVREKL